MEELEHMAVEIFIRPKISGFSLDLSTRNPELATALGFSQFDAVKQRTFSISALASDMHEVEKMTEKLTQNRRHDPWRIGAESVDHGLLHNAGTTYSRQAFEPVLLISILGARDIPEVPNMKLAVQIVYDRELLWESASVHGTAHPVWNSHICVTEWRKRAVSVRVVRYERSGFGFASIAIGTVKLEGNRAEILRPRPTWCSLGFDDLGDLTALEENPESRVSSWDMKSSDAGPNIGSLNLQVIDFEPWNVFGMEEHHRKIEESLHGARAEVMKKSAEIHAFNATLHHSRSSGKLT